MNRLDLQVGDRGGCAPAVDVRVDGRLLQEHARVVEQPFADAEGHPSIAGQYDGPDPGEVVGGEFTKTGRATLLVCDGCRESGCWPLEARVEMTADRVTWTEFTQPHRPGWDLSRLGPFTFDSAQYEAEVSKIAERSRPH